jgi:hypothetical protein
MEEGQGLVLDLVLVLEEYRGGNEASWEALFICQLPNIPMLYFFCQCLVKSSLSNVKTPLLTWRELCQNRVKSKIL